jgi:phosphohistidine phosphatase
MKRLTLIRHAKSSWKDPDCPDRDRPLTKRGKNDALAIGSLLRERGDRPSLIVSSPAKRAIATMKRIVSEMGLSEKKIVRDARLYDADSLDLLHFVREIEDTQEEVMVCGHNPALTDFCSFVAGTCTGNLPTAGIVCIDLAVDRWKNVCGGSGRIRFVTSPRESRLTDEVVTM